MKNVTHKQLINNRRHSLSRCLAPIVLGCVLGLVGNASAQPMGRSHYDSAAQGEGQSSSTRSLFLGTIVAMVAHSVGGALSAGVGGSITRWFNSEPAASAVDSPPPVAERRGRDGATGRANHRADQRTDPRIDQRGDPQAGAAGTLRMRKSQAQAQAQIPAQAQAAPRELYAGVAFEIHKIDAKGEAKPVDPLRHVFRTGDRFQIYYRPTLPARVKVINVNPTGKKARLDTVDVAAGELVTLGPYQFVDAKGDETLKLVLEPCSTPALTASTRAIIKVAAAAPDEQPALRIRECGDARTSALKVATRSIRKTTMEGSTAYALDRLSNDEVSLGKVAARSVQITLRHR